MKFEKGEKTKLIHSDNFGFSFAHHKLVGQHKLHAVCDKQIAYSITESCRAVVTARKN